MTLNRYFILGCFLLLACSKKGNDVSGNNHSPAVSLAAEIIQVNPFTFRFTATATDQEFDPMTFTWDFGEGTTKSGSAKESFSYAPDKEYTVKVTVSDGKSKPTESSVNINTRTTGITIDASKKFQTMDGCGGFGSQKEY